MLQEINPYTPILFKDHFDGFTQEHVNVCKEIISVTNHTDTYLEMGNAKSSVSNLEMRIHDHPAFKKFFDWQHQIVQEVLFNRFNVTNAAPHWLEKSWCNVHLNGGYTKAHCHGTSTLSMVAYIELPVDSGYLQVKDPCYDLKNILEKNNGDTDEEQWAEISAITGDVIFFPGWLQHRTQPNTTDRERWVVSTNYTNHQYLTFNNIQERRN